MSPLAHIGGLPLEESLVQLAPAALTAVMALRLAGERIRHSATRLGRGATRPKRAAGSRQDRDEALEAAGLRQSSADT